MQSFNKPTLSDIQKEYFESMSEGQRELIRKGTPVVFISLETGENICSFNTENYQPPEGALEMVARVILPDIIKYYENKQADTAE